MACLNLPPWNSTVLCPVDQRVCSLLQLTFLHTRNHTVSSFFSFGAKLSRSPSLCPSRLVSKSPIAWSSMLVYQRPSWRASSRGGKTAPRFLVQLSVLVPCPDSEGVSILTALSELTHVQKIWIKTLSYQWCPKPSARCHTTVHHDKGEIMPLNLGLPRLLTISIELPIKARVPSHLMHFPGGMKFPLKLKLHSAFSDFVWWLCISKPSHDALGLRQRLPGANGSSPRAVSQASCFFPGTISDANSEASLLWGLIIMLLFFFPS